MPYTIEFQPAAARELRKLPREVQLKVATTLDKLSEAPRPHGVKKLIGSEDLYRVRVGDYRIVYAIRDALLLVIVMRVRHRSDAYE